MDMFWGTGPDFQGSNQFGVVLMELRENFVNKKAEPPELPERPDQFTFSKSDRNFSNNSSNLVMYDDRSWWSAEHLFQAWKVRHSSFLTGMISKHLFNSSRMTQCFKA